MSIYITAVIPVYNSGETLYELYTRIKNVFNNINQDNFEVILIDDGSKDDSFIKMKELHERDARVKIIQLSKNFGQQNAIMCGLHYAQGEYVVTLDDDLQHPPEEIVKLLNKIRDGFDVVFGIPYEKKHSFYRNFGTKMIECLFNRICQKPSHIKVSSFRLMKKKIVQELIKNKTSFVYLAPMIFQVTTNVENVIVKHDARKYGKSNYSIYKLMKLFIKLIIHYSWLSRYLPVYPHPQFIIRYIEL